MPSSSPAPNFPAVRIVIEEARERAKVSKTKRKGIKMLTAAIAEEPKAPTITRSAACKTVIKIPSRAAGMAIDKYFLLSLLKKPCIGLHILYLKSTHRERRSLKGNAFLV